MHITDLHRFVYYPPLPLLSGLPVHPSPILLAQHICPTPPHPSPSMARYFNILRGKTAIYTFNLTIKKSKSRIWEMLL